MPQVLTISLLPYSYQQQSYGCITVPNLGFLIWCGANNAPIAS